MLYKSKDLVLKIKSELKQKISESGREISLTILRVGDDRATEVFVKAKEKFAESIGLGFTEYRFKEDATTEQLITKIKTIAKEGRSNAIVVQLPLPKTINTEEVLNAISLQLDADVLSVHSFDNFKSGHGLTPPVAGAVYEILQDIKVDISGKNIVIVGAGKLVGMPVYYMLKNLRARPQIIDLDTPKDVRGNLLAQADIIVTGTGVPGSILDGDIKEGVVIIDAGTSEAGGELVGDTDPECLHKAAIITAVPGGVGPLTVACLFKNIVEEALK